MKAFRFLRRIGYTFAYCRGYLSGINAVNPYRLFSPSWLAWREGWINGNIY